MINIIYFLLTFLMGFSWIYFYSHQKLKDFAAHSSYRFSFLRFFFFYNSLFHPKKLKLSRLSRYLLSSLAPTIFYSLWIIFLDSEIPTWMIPLGALSYYLISYLRTRK